MTRAITIIIIACSLSACSSVPAIDPYLKKSGEILKQTGQKIYDHFGDENEKKAENAEKTPDSTENKPNHTENK